MNEDLGKNGALVFDPERAKIKFYFKFDPEDPKAIEGGYIFIGDLYRKNDAATFLCSPEGGAKVSIRRGSSTRPLSLEQEVELFEGDTLIANIGKHEHVLVYDKMLSYLLPQK